MLRTIESVTARSFGTTGSVSGTKTAGASSAGAFLPITVDPTTRSVPPSLAVTSTPAPLAPNPSTRESTTRPRPWIPITPIALTRRATDIGKSCSPPVTVESSTRPRLITSGGGGVAGRKACEGICTVLRTRRDFWPSVRQVVGIVPLIVESSISTTPPSASMQRMPLITLERTVKSTPGAPVFTAAGCRP